MLRLEAVRIVQDDFALTADFTLPPAAVTAVLGPSGAGKSTLLGAIAGFVAPAAGRILWEGRDLTPLPPGARPVSILFQDNNLFPHLDIARNVALAITPAARPGPDVTDRVHAALAQLGLQGMEGRRPGALSGGQQSRAALARVLVAGRPVVLLDEPFAALGPALRAELLDLTRAQLLAAGCSVLMVTHDPADAARIADHAIVVAEGKVSPPAPTSALLADPPPALRAYLGQP
ncbi:MAG: ATP-binding cassette domain-containing protein [Limimaricola sp.]|uniref:thiamine ABC transporter ATP-binding protein n=1 Tax=Limimaricola sp. TaxID=2211665 RepID=UPI001D9A11AC|nr:ATP-binding cassette domain-containing protein [Limimaricola sp.]MBI1417092.1 ATP-binding cassette domain-containing protein [Limimaricola sp.]